MSIDSFRPITREELAITSLYWIVPGLSAAPWSPEFHPQPLPASVTAHLSGSAARGAQLFQAKRCIACHTIAGDGGQRGPDLTAIGSRLSPDELTWRIASGGNNMPAYGATLQPDEMTALVDFLSQLKARS